MDKKDLDRLEELELLLAYVLKKERHGQGRCLCVDRENMKWCSHKDYKNDKCLLV